MRVQSAHIHTHTLLRKKKNISPQKTFLMFLQDYIEPEFYIPARRFTVEMARLQVKKTCFQDVDENVFFFIKTSFYETAVL